jgi:hypothetical protein
VGSSCIANGTYGFGQLFVLQFVDSWAGEDPIIAFLFKVVREHKSLLSALHGNSSWSCILIDCYGRFRYLFVRSRVCGR